MIVKDALQVLCGSESRYRVFKALFESPEAEYHLRRLAAVADVDPSQVHKMLPGIIGAGLCEQVNALPHPRYRARKEHPCYEPLTKLFQSDMGGIDQNTSEDMGNESQVELRDAPVLRSLLWTGKERASLPAREAFKHYERNWRFVQRTGLTPKERALVDRLAKLYGHGLVNG